MSKIYFNPERHKEHIVIFRIGNTGSFVTYQNAINHPMISKSEFNKGKLLFDEEMNKPF